MIAQRSRALTHGQRERLDRVDQAFLHDGSVDRQTDERQRDQVACEFVAASRKLAGARDSRRQMLGLASQNFKRCCL